MTVVFHNAEQTGRLRLKCYVKRPVEDDAGHQRRDPKSGRSPQPAQVETRPREVGASREGTHQNEQVGQDVPGIEQEHRPEEQDDEPEVKADVGDSPRQLAQAGSRRAFAESSARRRGKQTRRGAPANGDADHPAKS